MIRNKNINRKNKPTENRTAQNRIGSALILTVVVTVMLAILGTVFLFAARVDKASTSSIADNKDLESGIDAALQLIATEIYRDIPGPDKPGVEYYDYPGPKDRWLAPLEPAQDPNDENKYIWTQVSDPNGTLARLASEPNTPDDADGDPVSPNSLPIETSLAEYPVYEDQDDPDFDLQGQKADADGDGIPDSRWIKLPDISSSTGKDIYAAVRVIDNSAMININTAYMMDVNQAETDNDANLIDGHSPMQINMAFVSGDPGDFKTEITDNSDYWRDTEIKDDPCDWYEYEKDILWSFSPPTAERYQLFDISDELELRNRYILNQPRIHTRIEDLFKQNIIDDKPTLPIEPNSTDDWFKTASSQPIKKSDDPEDYAFRHILTTQSIDNQIVGYVNQDILEQCLEESDSDSKALFNKQFDINIDLEAIEYDHASRPPIRDSQKYAQLLYAQLVSTLDPNLIEDDPEEYYRIADKFAQLAVNIVDMRDADEIQNVYNAYREEVTWFRPYLEIEEDHEYTNYEGGPNWKKLDERVFYGIEPYPIISEIAVVVTDPNDPYEGIEFAVELYNPYNFKMDIADFSINTDPDKSFPSFNFRYQPNASIPANDWIVIASDRSVFESLPENFDVNYEYEGLRLSYYKKRFDRTTARDIPIPGTIRSYNLYLRRMLEDVPREPKGWPRDGGSGEPRHIIVDRQLIPNSWVTFDPNDTGDPNQFDPNMADLERYFERETVSNSTKQLRANQIQWWYSAYPEMKPGIGTLGRDNNATVDPDIDISLPVDLVESDGLSERVHRLKFRTVGDIAKVWTVGPVERIDDPNHEDLFSVIFDRTTVKWQLKLTTDPNQLAGLFVPNQYTYTEQLRFASESGREHNIRLDLSNPRIHRIFQNIRARYSPHFDFLEDETRTKGRININTAPWYVIAQLPWMSDEVAKAIVAYRDKLKLDEGRVDYSEGRYDAIKSELDEFLGTGSTSDSWLDGFDEDEDFREELGYASIGELNLVIDGDDEYSIRKYALDNKDQQGYPDLTTSEEQDADEAEDDYEEKDLLFSRISNLTTVRSDSFTAYVLVRLGKTGPQKRAMATIDRSELNNVKITAYQPAIEPR